MTDKQRLQPADMKQNRGETHSNKDLPYSQGNTVFEIEITEWGNALEDSPLAASSAVTRTRTRCYRKGK